MTLRQLREMLTHAEAELDRQSRTNPQAKRLERAAEHLDEAAWELEQAENARTYTEAAGLALTG